MPSSKVYKRKRTTVQPSAAADTQQAEITHTTTGAPRSEAFAVKCSRQSELIDTDEACFVDCYNEEVDEAQEAAEDSATCFDGSWVWGSDPIKAGCAYYDYRDRTNDWSNSFAGGAGVPVVFRDCAAAKAAAFSVWQAILLAQERPSKPVLQQLEEQALGIKQLEQKAEERRRERHRQRREQHQRDWELHWQENARQEEQQLLKLRQQQQELIDQHARQYPQQQQQQQRQSRRGRQRQSRRERRRPPEPHEPHEQQLQQQLLELLQQQPRRVHQPHFSSRTPTPEPRLRRGRSAVVDSDTDSVRAAKQQAAAIDAAVSAGDQQAYLELLHRFYTVSAEGLSAWQADVEWLSDPWSDAGRETIKNVVLTTVRVEVVRASIV